MAAESGASGPPAGLLDAVKATGVDINDVIAAAVEWSNGELVLRLTLALDREVYAALDRSA